MLRGSAEGARPRSLYASRCRGPPCLRKVFLLLLLVHGGAFSGLFLLLVLGGVFSVGAPTCRFTHLLLVCRGLNCRAQQNTKKEHPFRGRCNQHQICKKPVQTKLSGPMPPPPSPWLMEHKAERGSLKTKSNEHKSRDSQHTNGRTSMKKQNMPRMGDGGGWRYGSGQHWTAFKKKTKHNN